MIQSHIAMMMAGMLACGMSACDRKDKGDALEGRPVSAVRIRYLGDREIDDVRIEDFISIKPGDRFTREAMDAEVKSLFLSGKVDDVRFLAEPDGDSVRLIAEVWPRPPAGPPFCIGNRAFSDMMLADASGLTKDRPITVESLEIARNRLRNHYINHGYLHAEVGCRAFHGGDPSPEDYVFVVEEGSPTPQPAAKENAQPKR